MSDLDDLLSQPLPPVADDGFSHRVMARIEAEQRRRDFAIWLAVSLGAAVVIPFLPMPEIVAMLGEALPDKIGTGLSVVTNHFATSLSASLALGALILTYLVDREFSRS